MSWNTKRQISEHLTKFVIIVCECNRKPLGWTFGTYAYLLSITTLPSRILYKVRYLSPSSSAENIYISLTFSYRKRRFCYLHLFTPSFLHFRHINLYTRPAFTSYCDFRLHQNTICPHLTSLTRCCTETSLPTSVTEAVVSLAPTTGKNIYFFNLDSSPGCKGCKRN